MRGRGEHQHHCYLIRIRNHFEHRQHQEQHWAHYKQAQQNYMDHTHPKDHDIVSRDFSCRSPQIPELPSDQE